MPQTLAVNRLPNPSFPSMDEIVTKYAPSAHEVIAFVDEIIGDGTNRLTHYDGSEKVSEFPWQWREFDFLLQRRTSVNGESTYSLEMSESGNSRLTLIADSASSECDVLLAMIIPRTGLETIVFRRVTLGNIPDGENSVLAITTEDKAATLYKFLTKLRECLDEK
jgi:hypothetical protein